MLATVWLCGHSELVSTELEFVRANSLVVYFVTRQSADLDVAYQPNTKYGLLRPPIILVLSVQLLHLVPVLPGTFRTKPERVITGPI